MSEPAEKRDWRDTVFLPKTDFPMKAGLAQKEPAILARWEAQDLYGQLRKARAGAEKFILHDGPPYANGDIHMGHAMNKVLKDIIVRSQTLLGKDAPYVPGWDCHGLPIEWKVEEQYRAKKLDKDQVDPIQFRAECRAYAEKWVSVQREQFKRLGVMGDWDDPYLTMKYEAEAAIAAELLKFAETRQLYRGAKPVMWSPVEKTALAEAEVEYEDITSTQIDVAFEIVESPIPELVGAHAVIWTTTPWTIPVNQALAYGPDVEYLLTDCWLSFNKEADDSACGEAMGRVTRRLPWFNDRQRLLIAFDLYEAFSARLNKVLAEIDISDLPIERMCFTLDPATDDDGKSLQFQRLSGADLAGTIARHPMHALGGFFAKPRPFLPGDFVTTDAGTGLVHMAPDHGEDDFLLCKANGIDPVFAVEGDGKYRADWAWMGGQGSVIAPKLNAPDGQICTDLRDAGALLAASQDYKHSYPHSWRSKAKLIFRCTPQWFIGMDRSISHDLLRADRGAEIGSQGEPWPIAGERVSPSLGTNGGRVAAAQEAPFVPSEVEGREAGDALEARTSTSLGTNGGGVAASQKSPFVPSEVEGREAGGALEARTSTSLGTNGGGVATSQKSPFVPSEVEGREAGDALEARTSTSLGTNGAPGAGGGAGGGSNAPTLRELALDAIAHTRWVPTKAENRITAMVEGRPDWVISRQRAWGVPIALYVNRKSGDYLVDPAVNARIVDAFRAGGADAWFTADHAALLGPGYDAADYEPVTDILDVWFDSGSTHSFVIEARYGEGVRANLYLEGSDQHRGWFQSSLLESCGTRGRAPYDAVLTHGFALDGQGRKMSKSLGNVVDPLKIIGESGADILRLWIASTDYFEDVRIGKEVLAGTSDAYRKLRNSFRYLLGALEGFGDAERLPVGEMPELERYMLHLVAALDAELREATAAFEFNRYARALTDFCNNDLSAFFFDIRKDSLYCDAPSSPTRRAYRTVLDILFDALVRWSAPILCFTAEEAWGTRFPNAGSVHLLEWPRIDAGWMNDDLRMKWQALRAMRLRLTGEIEPLRRGKVVGSSLEVDVTALAYDAADASLLRSVDFGELGIVAKVEICDGDPGAAAEAGDTATLGAVRFEVAKTEYEKCGRCWRHLPEVTIEDALCARCTEVTGG